MTDYPSDDQEYLRYLHEIKAKRLAEMQPGTDRTMTTGEWSVALLWDRVWGLHRMVEDEIAKNGEIHPAGYYRIEELLEDARRCFGRPLSPSVETIDGEIDRIAGLIRHIIKRERHY